MTDFSRNILIPNNWEQILVTYQNPLHFGLGFFILRYCDADCDYQRKTNLLFNFSYEFVEFFYEKMYDFIGGEK